MFFVSTFNAASHLSDIIKTVVNMVCSLYQFCQIDFFILVNISFSPVSFHKTGFSCSLDFYKDV